MNIKVDIKLFAMLLFFVFTNQGVVYLYLIIFAILHEIGHLLCGLYFGKKVRTVSIMPYGLSIEFFPQKDNWNTHFIISLAGPMVNFMLAIFIAILPINIKKDIMFYTNIILGLFNLIPMYPLDGGRMLKALLRKYTSRKMADDVTYKVSNAILIIFTMLASIGVYAFKNIAIVFIIAYLWALRIKENRRYNIKRRVRNILEHERINTDF